jgi:hypothetical protein
VHNANYFRYVRGSVGEELGDVAVNSKWARDPNITNHEIKNSGILGKELMADPPVYMVMASIPDMHIRGVHGSTLPVSEFENMVAIPKSRLTKLTVRRTGADPYYDLNGKGGG